MKKRKFKFFVNLFVILVVLGVVLYFSLKDNYEEILSAIVHMNVWYVVLAILILVLYRVLSSIGYYFVIRTNKETVSFCRCLQINFMILFFHGITPFAGGGQPMEVYYLHKEGISVTKATNITLQNFIVYQIALVLIVILALIYNYCFHLFPSNHFIKQLVVFGFTINLLVLVVSFLLSFGKRLQTFISKKGIHFLARLKFIRDEEKVQNKFQTYLGSFHKNALQLRKNKRVIIGVVLINLLGLFIMYSMPFVIARGMNMSLNLMDVIVATAYVMIIGSFVPIPGGTGGIEYGFVFFFRYLIQGSVVNALMLIWRFVSYYLGMTFGAIALSLYRKKGKICE